MPICCGGQFTSRVLCSFLLHCNTAMRLTAQSYKQQAMRQIVLKSAKLCRGPRGTNLQQKRGTIGKTLGYPNG